MLIDEKTIQALVDEYNGQLGEYMEDMAKVFAEDGEITINFKAVIRDSGAISNANYTLSISRLKIGGNKVSTTIDPSQIKLPI